MLGEDVPYRERVRDATKEQRSGGVGGGGERALTQQPAHNNGSGRQHGMTVVGRREDEREEAKQQHGSHGRPCHGARLPLSGQGLLLDLAEARAGGGGGIQRHLLRHLSAFINPPYE